MQNSRPRPPPSPPACPLAGPPTLPAGRQTVPARLAVRPSAHPALRVVAVLADILARCFAAWDGTPTCRLIAPLAVSMPTQAETPVEEDPVTTQAPLPLPPRHPAFPQRATPLPPGPFPALRPHYKRSAVGKSGAHAVAFPSLRRLAGMYPWHTCTSRGRQATVGRQPNDGGRRPSVIGTAQEESETGV